MSLESNIEKLTLAVQELTRVMADSAKSPVISQPVQASAPPVAAPVVAPVVTAPPLATQAVEMPAAPTFSAPVAAPAAQGAPFTDARGMMEYVMSTYTNLGAEKGAQIQGIITALGHQNINEIKPEQYGHLYSMVEALK